MRTYPRLLAFAWTAPLAVLACSSSPPPQTPPAAAPVPAVTARPDEPHLADLRQLTFGGENAEAYWSWDGTSSSSRRASCTAQSCDRIYRMPPMDSPPTPVPVSSGKGATTCSYFLPGDQEVIYASTHLGGDACPPRPDQLARLRLGALPELRHLPRERGRLGRRRLTDTPGYDAEGTVCGKDGSIVFTSVRDGDLDLYRMDSDGKDVRSG